MQLFSPAKINLFLRVFPRREDGYHPLVSYMQTIDLGDVITASRADRDSLVCSLDSLPPLETNLLGAALRLFRQETRADAPVAIELEKKIPVGAGLGGGSSNAATLLFLLNALFETKIPESRLQAMSASIGSDVPFFFSNGSARCEGRGEKVFNVSPWPESARYLCLLQDSLSSASVYKTYRENSCWDPSNAFAAKQMRNDLQAAAFALLPRLERVQKDLLQHGFDSVTLTGSGSALICQGEPKEPWPFDESPLVPIRFIAREPGEWYAAISR